MATKSPRKSAPRRGGAFFHPHHDHQRCASAALHKAEEVCAKRGARLTEIRRQVLSAVWSSHRPIGAYDILAQMNARGGKTAPMAVYRALDFLMAYGLVHRLASLNAFIGCAFTDEHHAAHFLICRNCKTAAETQAASLARVMAQTFRAHGFTAETQVIEIQGLCRHCSDHDHVPAP